jgi:Zn-dependent M16 (insulinase) family peptidase
MDAGIGKEVLGFFSKNKQNFLIIAVKNANDTDKEKFRKIVFDTLQKVVKKGLDKRVLEGALNRLEFRLREGRRFPGLSHTFNALPGWMFANDPFLSLEYEKPLDTLKKGLKTNYFETLIETYLLKNNHSLMLTMTPKKGMVEEGRKKLKEKLAKYKASLSHKELEKLVQQTKELKKYKETPDSPEALNTIPLLSLKDVGPKAEKLEVDVREIAKAPGVKVLAYPVFTNNIIYTRLLFDASVVPQELIPYTALLAEILGELSTRNYSYGDLDTELNLHTGGVNFRIGTYTEDHNHRKIIPKFEVTGKVLRDKFDKLMVLEGEIIKNTIFKDSKRLKEVITRLKARHQMSIQRMGLRLAFIRLGSYFSPSGKYLDLTRGLSYVHFVMDIGENFDKKVEEVISNLQKTAALIFNKNNLIVTVTCPDQDYKLFKEKCPKLLAYIGNKSPKPVKYTFEYKEKNEGLQSASMVQYVTQGYDYKALGYTYSGKFQVLAHILKRDYLQRKVRILGGAYGREAEFTREGLAVFASYRDPQLTKTLEAYDQAADYVKDLKLDDREMTRFILGTIAKKDRPLRPYQKGRQAVSNYLQDLTYDQIQKERDEILSTTPEDIRKMAKMVADIMSKKTICVFGNEKKLEENKKLFDKLVKVKQ